jgi:hypothetical protein
MLHAVAEAAADDNPAQIFEYLCSRLLDTGSRASLAATPPELAELMLDLAGTARHLFDPACGSGAILLAGVRRGYARVEGQELNPSLALITALRLAMADVSAFDVHAGDSLRDDSYPLGSAEATVCDPPFADRNWGHEELVADRRWEYELPSASNRNSPGSSTPWLTSSPAERSSCSCHRRQQRGRPGGASAPTWYGAVRSAPSYPCHRGWPRTMPLRCRFGFCSVRLSGKCHLIFSWWTSPAFPQASGARADSQPRPHRPGKKSALSSTVRGPSSARILSA